MDKNHISLYMFRNAFATLFITLFSFICALMTFYQCDLLVAMQRLFIYDLFTVLYFILLCLVNYMVFEISKILHDEYQTKIPYYYLVATCIVLSLIIFSIDILPLFQYNISLLALLILARVIKQAIKNKELIMKRPTEWSIIKKLMKK